MLVSLYIAAKSEHSDGNIGDAGWEAMGSTLGFLGAAHLAKLSCVLLSKVRVSRRWRVIASKWH